MAALSVLLMIEIGVTTLFMQALASRQRLRAATLLIGFVVVAVTLWAGWRSGVPANASQGVPNEMVAMTALLAVTLMLAPLLGGRR